MKSKRLIQVLVVFVLMFGSFGGSQAALASTNSAVQSDAMVFNRNLNFWDATYVGFVSDLVHERWHFDFTETHTFTVTVSAISGDLVPLLTLQDTNGNQISQGVSTLTSTQPAGNYSIQVEPNSGSGFYVLTLREVVQTQPNVVTTVTPGTVNVGETAVATVNLNNVPTEGYTSAEFTCTYNASLITVGSPVPTSLFGTDPVVAVNGPQNGSFIVAIAGSNGQKATTSGTAFTFSVTGLLAGQTPINCDARVSKGDNVLTDLSATGTSLTVTGTGPTATFTPTPVVTATSTTPVASPTATSLTPADTATPTSLTPADTATPSSTPVASATPTSLTPADTVTPTSLTPTDTATPTSTEVPSATPTSLTPTDTPTATSTPVVSPTVTSTPLPNGAVNGQVLATKPVTVSLLDAANAEVATVVANPDGTFSLSAPAGTYTLRAAASGFLTAQGSITLTSGNTITKPALTLLAGDIDGNNVIDQLDALTIGMNYNTATPVAADLNNDGIINVLDLELLAKNYRQTGPVAWP